MRTIAAVIALLPICTLAQDEYPRGFFGGEFGLFDYSEEFQGDDLSDDTTFIRVYGGIQLNERASLELGYGETDDLEWSESFFVGGIGTVNANIAASFDLLSLNFFGSIPLGESGVSIFGGPGYYDADGKVVLTLTDGVDTVSESESSSENGWMLSGGLQFGQENLRIRIKYDWYDTDADVEAWGLGAGAHYMF